MTLPAGLRVTAAMRRAADGFLVEHDVSIDSELVEELCARIIAADDPKTRYCIAVEPIGPSDVPTIFGPFATKDAARKVGDSGWTIIDKVRRRSMILPLVTAPKIERAKKRP